MNRFVSILFCAIPLILAGCGQKQLASTPPQSHLQLSSLPTSEQRAIFGVARMFGDAEPKVREINQSVTEVDQKPMYMVWLSGHFHQGKVQSNNLYFSILADGTKAWAITNKSGSFKPEDISMVKINMH